MLISETHLTEKGYFKLPYIQSVTQTIQPEQPEAEVQLS
jgi:hypothetical protein